ncbi:VOC family protein [Goodfellowiella coeruleoviolacea]|uniref:Glyoxalase superfamily enzyme, possibly 3-demethylubiquinone-9 3-methyltransferase n=1 Tax=Goodfellowiella coeruleoviolacea TaxID=334858 RepID=A0AAE3GB65_9PSEU|nr:VOC family protein [Goodfellowiella coeruleoviolacea]MCP2165031.1 Glyoxalase superfamily enzyme, possibly 3-demethylubiquinone-9 3-methyltransferase [Goodfellowiella coeruleoviolacea]
MREIVTHLAFDNQAEEAVRFYTSLIPNSRITGITHFRADEPGPEGTVRTIRFEMLGQKFLAVNGGPHFTFTEGVSLLVACDTQAEIDELWERLRAGGTTQPCGWVTDRYGLSWQITAAVEDAYLYGPDPEAAQRVVSAIYRMTKIDIAEIERAYRGE